VICFDQENNGEDVVDNLGGRSSQKVFGKVNRQILGEFKIIQLTCLMETYNNGNIYTLVNVYIANWKDPLFVCLPEGKAWFPKGVCPPADADDLPVPPLWSVGCMPRNGCE
jgi:hypothetical protein